MKINYKIICFGLVASFGCLSAQEALSGKEISMSSMQDRCGMSGDCSGDKLGIDCPSRADDYDYDVYTVGEREECCPSPCRQPCEERRCKKSDNNDCNRRRSSARSAQD